MVTAVILIQILAGSIAVLYGRFGDWFIDFWFGGAAASIFGYLIGVIWQMKSVKRSWELHRPMLILIGIISLALFVAAFGLPLDQFASNP